MSYTWTHLIRFANPRGEVYYADTAGELNVDLLTNTEIKVLSGTPFSGFVALEDTQSIHKILCPLDRVPIIQCIGVNYAKHAKEANFKVPSQPVVFAKPEDSKAGPFDVIHCPRSTQSQLDYEGELCFVFGQDCKNVAQEDAMDVILGYTIGNDLSARNFIPQEVSGFQMSYGKSFDSFAPFGPLLVASHAVEDCHNLVLTTRVNGQRRQHESTSDMIWKIPQIVAHITQGRTVRAGTVCMTGTPSGVGWFMDPSGFLKDGDDVEVSIEKLGTMCNRMVFE